MIINIKHIHFVHYIQHVQSMYTAQQQVSEKTETWCSDLYSSFHFS